MSAVIAPPKPRFRGRIHQVAFFVSIPAGVLLILLANGPAAIAVASVYAVSLAAVFGSSAVYHRGQWTERARRWMKRLDHSLIFVLIAASYTPVAALVLGGPWEVVLLSVIWTGAVVGITMKMARPDGLSIPSAALYMVLGWLAIVALPQLARRDDPRRADPPAGRRPPLHGRSDRVREPASRPLAFDLRLSRGLALVHGRRGGLPLRDDPAPAPSFVTGSWYRGRRGRYRRP